MYDELSRNGDGYYDPTAYKAMKSLEKDEKRFRKLLQLIFDICEISGFHLESRITVRDKKTGKVWR